MEFEKYLISLFYSIIKSNIIEQNINMRKINFQHFGFDEDRINNLFGKNEIITKESFIYNIMSFPFRNIW